MVLGLRRPFYERSLFKGKNWMKALWLENKKLIFRDDLPIPEPSENEALIKVISAGILRDGFRIVRRILPIHRYTRTRICRICSNVTI